MGTPCRPIKKNGSIVMVFVEVETFLPCSGFFDTRLLVFTKDDYE